MSYFIYNNIKSSDLGVRIISKNIYSAPKYDVSLTSIPGRNGDLINPNGRYANVSLSYTCYVPAKSIDELSKKITAIKNWLYNEPDSYHVLEDSYDTLFQRNAVFNNKLDISDEARKIGTFTVTFSCEPFRYLKSSLVEESHDSTFTLSNPYSFIAKPYLKIYGNGDGRLIISNSKGTTVWNFTSIDSYIECDSELMNFYKGTELKNSSVSGDGFPELIVGDSTISFEGNITRIDIKARWVSL